MATIQTDSTHTRAWCRKNEFSGIRSDPILENVEIWVLGRVAKEVSKLSLNLNPRAVQEAYAEVFCLDPANVEVM